MKNIIVIFAALLMVSCVSNRGMKHLHRKVQIVDFQNRPINEVSTNVRRLWGVGSKLSNEQGFMYVPRGAFALERQGYKVLWVDSNDKTMVYQLELEDRSNEFEIIMDNGKKNAEWHERNFRMLPTEP